MDSISPVNPNAAQGVQAQPSTDKAAEAARQFEAIFLRQFLEKALEPSIKGAMSDGGNAGSIYRSHMVDVLSDEMSRTGAFGFGSTLQQALQSHPSTAPQPTQTPNQHADS